MLAAARSPRARPRAIRSTDYEDTGIRRLEASRLANEGVDPRRHAAPGRSPHDQGGGPASARPDVRPARARSRVHAAGQWHPRGQHGRLRRCGARSHRPREAALRRASRRSQDRTSAASASSSSCWRCSRRSRTPTRTTSKRAAACCEHRRDRRRLLAVRPHTVRIFDPKTKTLTATRGAGRRPGNPVRVARLDAFAELELSRGHGHARSDAAAPVRGGVSACGGRDQAVLRHHAEGRADRALCEDVRGTRDAERPRPRHAPPGQLLHRDRQAEGAGVGRQLRDGTRADAVPLAHGAGPAGRRPSRAGRSSG